MITIESIAGLPVRIATGSIHAAAIRRNVAAVAARARINRVETDFTRHGSPQVTYHLSEPRVKVVADAGMDADRILGAVSREAARIARHEADCMAPRAIDAADAHLAGVLRCGPALRQLSRTGLDPARIWLWNGNSHSFSTAGASVKIDDAFAVHLSGKRVWIGRATEMETWSQGNLVTGRRLQIPDTVMAALKGRRLDEVVEGTMLRGAGLTIRNAWMNGGRLGLTFDKRDLPLDEVVARIDGGLRRAA